MHYTVSGAVADVIGMLRWARQNPFVDPTDIVLVSVSFSSVAARHVLTRPEGADVSRWISIMGAADAQSSVLHVSGNIDLVGNHRRGVRNGILSLVGCMVDADHFCEDLEEIGMGTLEDARREMARIKAAVTWLVGKHDAWHDPRRIHDVMSVKAPGEREIIELDAGHVPTSSQEALAQFRLITRILFRHFYGRDDEMTSPSAGFLAAVSEKEWERVRRPRLGSAEDYWREYLLGKDGIGFDVLALAPEYQAFVAEEVRLAEPGGRRVLDLGAGTGIVSRALAEAGPGELVSADLVPEALERLRARLPEGASVETVVCDADGGPWVALRRWIHGELPGLESLAGRIPGLSESLVNRLKARYGPRLHALLRGEALDPDVVARRMGLADCADLLSDVHRLSRAIRGRARVEHALAGLRRIPADAFGRRRGLPFPDGRFDAVVLSLVLSYLEHPEDTLSEIHRVLVPGGILVLSSMKPDADSSKLFLDLLGRLESARDDELPPGADRDKLVEAARAFVNSAAGLFRLEEEGQFRFYEADDLVDLVQSAGFDECQVSRSFGDPPQAVVVRCRRM